jgi:hypothetical protein
MMTPLTLMRKIKLCKTGNTVTKLERKNLIFQHVYFGYDSHGIGIVLMPILIQIDIKM